MWNGKCKFLFIMILHPHSPVVTIGNNWALVFYSTCIYIHPRKYTQTPTRITHREAHIQVELDAEFLIEMGSLYSLLLSFKNMSSASFHATPMQLGPILFNGCMTFYGMGNLSSNLCLIGDLEGVSSFAVLQIATKSIFLNSQTLIMGLDLKPYMIQTKPHRDSGQTYTSHAGPGGLLPGSLFLL